MDLEEYLYAYIEEDRAGTRKGDAAYQEARRERNRMQRELVMALTMKQRRMFHEYMEQEDLLSAMERRRVFRETASLFRALLAPQ